MTCAARFRTNHLETAPWQSGAILSNHKGKANMANIDVHKETSSKPSAALARERLSPFRALRELLRLDPFSEMAPLWAREERAAFEPDFDVKETEDAFVFSADLPGMEAKDVDVTLSDNRLSISGTKEQKTEEKGETFYRCERSYGAFSRSFTLPMGVDKDRSNAELKNGVLTVTINKKPEARPKQIDVKPS
jgi:HSP20 family protein